MGPEAGEVSGRPDAGIHGRRSGSIHPERQENASRECLSRPCLPSGKCLSLFAEGMPVAVCPEKIAVRLPPFPLQPSQSPNQCFQ